MHIDKYKSPVHSIQTSQAKQIEPLKTWLTECVNADIDIKKL